MKIQMAGAVALLLLVGCTSSKPGAFEKIDEDPISNTVQYRFNPQKVNRDAMLSDLAEYCSQKGFDIAEPLPIQDSNLPGLKKVWYQCNYSLKG
ncbi:hypothetical protein ED28_14075 [[Pantoea] beijingensis]|uniref:Lipoprotein n=1 Tax=[Pantoea] beijingensis TaxID=1324864 RepID=A0A443IAZ2_9GAMM|nr:MULTISPECIES: hypothetical protein [Erwiniaceae]RWR01259.1 hypothetical protein ED28_14075 [[Pantoea] beijingensis]